MTGEPDHLEPEIPPRLAEAIRRHEAGRGVDLSALDRAVLEGARGRVVGVRGSGAVGTRSGGRSVIWRIGGAVAAAAGLALAVYVAWPGARGGGGGAGTGLAYNASGGVTILDAFQLARLLESESARGRLSATWDVTGDGAIDQRDVDAIAARAVRLSGSGGGT